MERTTKDLESFDLDWLFRFRSPADIWEHHPDLLKLELCCYTCAVLTFLHAFRVGGRFPYLWTSVLLQGIILELVSYWYPYIDNYWHAQSMVMLLGQRLPLYIVCIYTIFIYTPCAVVEHSGVKWWAKPFAGMHITVGLTAVSFDLPLDIMNSQHLFWTWHDTDPNISDRHYGVPWTNYFFIISGFGGFYAVFHGVHKLLAAGLETTTSIGFFREMVCGLSACILSSTLAVLQFILIYHPLHDMYHIHGEVCTMLLLMLYGLIVWLGDRRINTARGRDTKSSTGLLAQVDAITAVVVLVNTFLVYLVLTSRPENIASTGLHETVGPCNVTQDIITPLGQVLSRRKYLCLTDFNRKYYTLDCSRDLPSDGQQWYTICGRPYENRVEHIVVVGSLSFLCVTWCLTLLRSGDTSGSRKQRQHLKQN